MCFSLNILCIFVSLCEVHVAAPGYTENMCHFSNGERSAVQYAVMGPNIKIESKYLAKTATRKNDRPASNDGKLYQ